MGLIIGVDEAGYGPNLGPLAVCATAWRIPSGLNSDNLTKIIPQITAERPGKDEIQIADSKVMYKPGSGIETLENTVQVMSRVSGFHLELASDWHSWIARFDPQWTNQTVEVPWFHGDRELPVTSNPDVINDLSDSITASLAQCGIELIDIEMNLIPAKRFNELLKVNNGKGELLSNASAALVKSLLNRISIDAEEPVLVHFDKHGGRNQYLPLLMQTFPDVFIQIIREGREMSEYRWGDGAGLGEGNIQCRFVAKGDRFLPAALASNFAKYARELAMMSFNTFWRQKVADLKPTAGYPVDAKRFKQEIETVQRDLGISDDILWRQR